MMEPRGFSLRSSWIMMEPRGFSMRNPWITMKRRGFSMKHRRFKLKNPRFTLKTKKLGDRRFGAEEAVGWAVSRQAIEPGQGPRAADQKRKPAVS